MTCIYSGCQRDATLHAYPVLGKGGEVHACHDCAPQWLREGRFVGTYYAPTPVPPYAVRKQLRDATLAIGRDNAS